MTAYMRTYTGCLACGGDHGQLPLEWAGNDEAFTCPTTGIRLLIAPSGEIRIDRDSQCLCGYLAGDCGHDDCDHGEAEEE